MCLFRLNGYVIVVFGSIAKELNVRLAMGSLLAICLAICFVIIGCTPAVIRGDSVCALCPMGRTPAMLVFGEARALSCEVLVVSGLKISISL